MDKIDITNEQVKHFNTIISFLSARDLIELSQRELKAKFKINQVDLLILLGNSITFIAEQAAKAYKSGIAKEIMIVGGIGHSTKYLRDNIKKHYLYKFIETVDRPEADILKDILVSYQGISEKDIIIENQSTNCGSNAKEALKVIKDKHKKPKSVILMQDPTMQIRTYYSFLKEWSQEDVIFINYSAFIPFIKESAGVLSFTSDEIDGLWDIDRFLSLVMGEVPRLRDDKDGYGPKGKGYILHVDIPKEVLSAYDYLLKFYSEYIIKRNKNANI